MKRRYLAVLMGVMVATTSVPAMVYAEDVKTERAADEASDESSEKADGSDENAQSDEAEENVVLGEVKSVSDTEITIAVGTMKEMGQPGGNGQGQTITITENTVITKQSGGMQQGQTGGDGQNGGVPEKPDGDGQDGEAPEKSDGETSEADGQTDADNQDSEKSEDDGQNSEAPEKPDGDQNGGAPEGNGQGAEAEEISLSDIQEGDIVSITLDEDGNAASITVMSMEMSGQSQGVDSYTAVNEYTEDTTVSGETLESTGTDENAALISSGASVTLDNDTITRTSDSSTGGDNSSFYGVGAAVLATDGTAYVKDGSVTTDAAGGAGLFAYGDGTVYASGTTVKTTQDTSGGVHVAGGGTLYGWNLDVETNGESSAAIRSDRGGGTMVIDGGNYVSNGVGSPAIYSTADIAVSNASLTANGSEAVCIEGLNSIHLYDCDLTGNMSDLDQNDNTWTVILYQSMSGDSEVGNSTFQMDGGSLTSENGGVFYTTNTESTITLSNVDINYNDDNEFFLQCTGNTNQRGWGQSGANGADCHFTGISQDMQGNVIWDSISDLDFYLTEGSSLTGAVVDDETYAGEGGDGYCNVYVSSDSTWTVTGDSTVSSLENEGTIVDSEGKTVTIQGTDGTVYVQGDSEYTITTGSYSDSVDLSGATSIQDQSAYTVEKPDQL
ncbi:MAG TPA: hypothetical protein DHW25_00720 [Blautia sp.]|nr:hypothetical protein [Blautia sp.]